MDKQTQTIPDDEANNPFRNLAFFLQRGVSVGTLATAIKRCGIYTTDEYGRSGEASEVDKSKALKYLAGYRAWEQDRDPVTNMHNEMDPLSRTAGDETPFSHSGWFEDDLPDFCALGDDDHVDDWSYWCRKSVVTPEEFCILRLLYDPRNIEADRDTFLESAGTTLGDSVGHGLRYIERHAGGSEPGGRNLEKWIEWSERLHWQVPFYMFAKATPGTAGRPATKPVTSAAIKAAFVIPPTGTRNGPSDAWWDERMGDAKRYGLVECRAARGRAKMKSLWYPERVACWLIEKKHLSESTVVAIVCRYFPDASEYVDFDPPT